MDFHAETETEWNALVGGRTVPTTFKDVKTQVLTYLEKLANMKGVESISCRPQFRAHPGVR